MEEQNIKPLEENIKVKLLTLDLVKEFLDMPPKAQTIEENR